MENNWFKDLFIDEAKQALVAKDGPTPDLSENDPTKPGYVEGRTHYDKSEVLFEGPDGLVVTFDRKGWSSYANLEVSCGSNVLMLSGVRIIAKGVPTRTVKTVTHTLGQVGGVDLVVTFTYKTAGSFKITANIADCNFVVRSKRIVTLDDKYISPNLLRYETSINVNIDANDTYGKNGIVSVRDTYDELMDVYYFGVQLYCVVQYGEYTSYSGGVRHKYYLPLVESTTHLYDTTEPYIFSSIIPGDTYQIVTVKVTNENVWTFNIRAIDTTDITT